MSTTIYYVLCGAYHNDSLCLGYEAPLSAAADD